MLILRSKFPNKTILFSYTKLFANAKKVIPFIRYTKISRKHQSKLGVIFVTAVFLKYLDFIRLYTQSPNGISFCLCRVFSKAQPSRYIAQNVYYFTFFRFFFTTLPIQFIGFIQNTQSFKLMGFFVSTVCAPFGKRNLHHNHTVKKFTRG